MRKVSLRGGVRLRNIRRRKRKDLRLRQRAMRRPSRTQLSIKAAGLDLPNLLNLVRRFRGRAVYQALLQELGIEHLAKNQSRGRHI